MLDFASWFIFFLTFTRACLQFFEFLQENCFKLWSIHTLIHSLINPFIQWSIYSSIHQSVSPFIHSSTHPSIIPSSIYSSIHLLIHLFHSFIHWSIDPFTNPLIHSSIHSFTHIQYFSVIHADFEFRHPDSGAPLERILFAPPFAKARITEQPRRCKENILNVMFCVFGIATSNRALCFFQREARQL